MTDTPPHADDSATPTDETGPNYTDEVELQDPVRAGMLAKLETNPRAYIRWSEAEEDRLLELLRAGSPPAEIADELQRTTSAVRSRARRVAFTALFGRELPLHDPEILPETPWTLGELRELLDLVPTASSWTDIGRRLGRNPSACRRKAEQEAILRISRDSA